jgi:hypothetical protein
MLLVNAQPDMTLSEARRLLLGKRIVDIRNAQAVTDDSGRQTGEIQGDLVIEDDTIVQIPGRYWVREPNWPLDPRD